MVLFTDVKEVMEQSGEQNSYTLLDERNGCVAGCRSGITIYRSTEFGKGGIHEDQEGFFVLSGEGVARIGENEFPIYEGMSFLAPAGVRHTIKSNCKEVPVKVFWFHSAV
ncbi:MAG: cupin domain-containing protein [Lachnospiraceae bacterium]|nr:cupin domain-containing protein [Lachnospiraceae bacterium]